MKDVYVVMYEFNGHQGLVDVYAHPEAAEKAVRDWEEEFAVSKEDCAFVLQVPLL